MRESGKEECRMARVKKIISGTVLGVDFIKAEIQK